MYEFLEGALVDRGPTHVVLDVNGVGYDVAVPVGSDFRPVDGGERVRVWTHLSVREDAHQLFGFPTRELRELFRLLLVVRGVGPGLALAILSNLPGDELLEAIVGEDLAALTRVKGVGKKTAQQILLDLRDRAPALRPALAGTGPSPAPAGSASVAEDAVRALVSIGYTEKEARKSVDRAAKRTDSEDLELLVRTALRGRSFSIQ